MKESANRSYVSPIKLVCQASPATLYISHWPLKAMAKHLFLIFAILLHASPEAADWEDFSHIPKSTAATTMKGFGGWLTIIPSEEVDALLATPKKQTLDPHQVSGTVTNRPLTVLTFYTNPHVNAEGSIELVCDYRLVTPSGETDLEQLDVPCVSTKLVGNPNALRLTRGVIQFTAEDHLPKGQWNVDVRITNTFNGDVLRMRAPFQFDEK